VIKRDPVGIGFDGQELADQTRRHTVTVAVEVDSKVLIDKRLVGITVVGRKGRQRTKGVGAETVDGTLTSFAVQARIGDFLQPLPHLAMDIRQVGERAEGPEVLANIRYPAALHFTFLPCCRRIAGPGVKAVFAGESQETGMEAHEGSHVFGDRRSQVVIPKFASHTTQRLEGMLVAADEGLEALAVSELHIEEAAVALDQAEGIELALVALIVEGVEVAPVDFEALAGTRFHAHEGAGRRDLGPQAADAIAQDGDATLIAEGA
jgi:hypothetical protein